MTDTCFEILGETLDALPQAERLPAEPVCHAFAAPGIPRGAELLDAAMTRLVLDTDRPLAIRCPPHTDVTADEARLLAAAAAAQEHDDARASMVLSALLPAASAAVVAASLTRLGLHLAAAGLPLCDGGDPAAVSRPTLH